MASHISTGLNYVLTADVAKKEKGQLPRVYFVLPGETVGQVAEKLQLAYLEEACRHYVAHVKVSPPPPSQLVFSVRCMLGASRSVFLHVFVIHLSYLTGLSS